MTMSHLNDRNCWICIKDLLFADVRDGMDWMMLHPIGSMCLRYARSIVLVPMGLPAPLATALPGNIPK